MTLFRSAELKKLNPVETVLALAKNFLDPNTPVENEFRLVTTTVRMFKIYFAISRQKTIC
jgi:hypothetical protein